MAFRSVLAVLTLAGLAAPPTAMAQTAQAQVTLQVPVNLTQFGPDVAKVRVACTIRSDPITTSTTWGVTLPDGRPATGDANHQAFVVQEIPMSTGQLVTTASLVFAFSGLDNPAGKNAAIVCSLHGWSTSQQAWVQFTGGATNPSFRTTGASVGMVDGAFVW